VLTNLLGNAVKYSPTGGDVVLSIEREVKQQRKMAVVRVADHGLGIPAADLPHVFEQFHRGSNVTGRVAGTGLGLAAARQIVEQHGGSLEVASQEHQGSTFTMRLPLVPDRLLT
jgi:signal transduction histidine kinase